MPNHIRARKSFIYQCARRTELTSELALCYTGGDTSTAVLGIGGGKAKVHVLEKRRGE
jgi:hypothetical protein